MTEQKKAEELLISEQRRAADANRAKSTFLAVMSHEIRTPMNAILGMADLLWETELESVQRQYVEIFRRAGGNLLTLVNHILDLSKIESGHFELESVDFDLRELVERTTEIVSPKAKAKQLELLVAITKETPSALTGDPTRLQQILINLIGNAVKFTEQGSVTLSIQPESANNGHLSFKISDTGIGIPADKLEGIFDDFAQAESSTTRRFGGTGLGLGICRRLVQRMGGELKVHSVYGAGSSFQFSAKFGVAAAVQLLDCDSRDDVVGRRVLIVDDHQTNLLIFTDMCQQWGLETYDCSEWTEALEVLSDSAQAQKPFDLMILDRTVSGSGFESATQAKALFPSMAIIVTAAEEVSGEATRCKQLGLGHAVKPVRRSELLRLICQSLAGESVPVSGFNSSGEDRPGTNRSGSQRLLIADDSEDNRFLLQAYLRATGYEIVFVENGKCAVDACRSQDFDLVLMDMQMPVMDGLTATKAIRLHEQSAGRVSTPILALTANARRDDIEACEEAGCTAHLSKPIAKAKLLKAIEQYASKSAVSSRTPRVVVDVPPGLEEGAKQYIKSKKNDAIEMKQFLAEQNFDRLRVLAHNMKGTGLPFGFPLVTELGSEIEASAKERDVPALVDQLLRLSEYVGKASYVVETSMHASS